MLRVCVHTHTRTKMQNNFWLEKIKQKANKLVRKFFESCSNIKRCSANLSTPLDMQMTPGAEADVIDGDVVVEVMGHLVRRQRGAEEDLEDGRLLRHLE